MTENGLKQFVLHVLDEVDTELQMSLDGMPLEQIMWRPSEQANSMAWIAWHMARLQDARAAALAEREQLWSIDGWHERFGLPADPANNGRGHTDAQVDEVRPQSVQALSNYASSASNSLVAEIKKLDNVASDDELQGESGDATVKDLVFRAVHGGLAHSGQLMYVRGLVEKRHWFPR